MMGKWYGHTLPLPSCATPSAVTSTPAENLDFDRLIGAPEMRALLYGSLTRYQQQHEPITQPIVMMPRTNTMCCAKRD